MNLLIFPHQLFADHPGLAQKPTLVALVEDSLFFGDAGYPCQFHKQKMWLHRATMKRYQSFLQDEGFKTKYFEYKPTPDSLRDHLQSITGRTKSKRQGQKLVVADPTDFLLLKRLRRYSRELGLKLEVLPSPMFINQPEENQEYRSGKKRWFMADFYRWQRQRLNILVEDGEPAGGQWSFDDENRKKIPKKMLSEIPRLPTFQRDEIDQEAVQYVEERFSDRPGHLNDLYYPTSHTAAKRWLTDFLKHRFRNFGDYEDAIEPGQSWLWHSVLTPCLNIGLLTPQQVVAESLKIAKQEQIPLNSLEGFIRQVIGWREFMRATYEDLGVRMRTTNHWGHERSMPSAFYEGTTGVDPIDDTIHRVLETGYCHHIERLMVLGGFMFLCRLDPNEIYRWFMELFVDSYDWVMVPNVYAMSQHADGGLITTKPYFSGSAYVRKMSHYPKGEWCDIWDALYWRWIWKHKDQLRKNPRWAMMCSTAERMDASKRQAHLDAAASYLKGLK